MTAKINALEQAADYIGEKGWCAGDWYQKNGKACLAGAIGVVTGALVPLTAEEREKTVRAYVKGYHKTASLDFETEVARTLKDTSAFTYKWSTAKRPLKAYRTAVMALAETIDAEKLKATVDAIEHLHAQRRLTRWYQGLTPKDRAEQETQWAKRLVEAGADIVIDMNDRTDYIENKGIRRKTTKAQAIKLLRTAAARMAA